jgi:hypothetical protein
MSWAGPGCGRGLDPGPVPGVASGLARGRPRASHEVEDLEVTVSELRARGVVFEEYDLPTLRTVGGIAKVGPSNAAWIRDPDGNYLGIHDSGP